MSHRIFMLCLCFQNFVFYKVIAFNMTWHCTRYTYNSSFPWTCIQFFLAYFYSNIYWKHFSLLTQKTSYVWPFVQVWDSYPLRNTVVFNCPRKSTPHPINSCRGLSLHPGFSLSGGWIFRYSPWLLLRQHTPFWQQLYHPISAPKGNVTQPVL